MVTAVTVTVSIRLRTLTLRMFRNNHEIITKRVGVYQIINYFCKRNQIANIEFATIPYLCTKI